MSNIINFKYRTFIKVDKSIDKDILLQNICNALSIHSPTMLKIEKKKLVFNGGIRPVLSTNLLLQVENGTFYFDNDYSLIMELDFSQLFKFAFIMFIIISALSLFSTSWPKLIFMNISAMLLLYLLNRIICIFRFRKLVSRILIKINN